MYKLLDQSKRTQKSADPTPKQNAVKHDDADDVIRGALVGCRQCILQRSERTSPRRARAGIAIESGGADVFNLSHINIAIAKAFEIGIKEQCRV